MVIWVQRTQKENIKGVNVANISGADKFKRLHVIKEAIDEGKTDIQIAEEYGMSLRTVQRNRIYLKDLAIADLTNKEISSKREELYLELLEATGEIRGLFDFYKTPQICPICKGNRVITVDEKSNPCTLCHSKGVIHFPKEARRFYDAWLEAVELRAKLYGLDTIKVDSLVQLNQFNQYSSIPDIIDAESGKTLADMIKVRHESKLKKLS